MRRRITVRKIPISSIPKGDFAAHENMPAEDVQSSLGVSKNDLLMQKVNEIAGLLWTHESVNQITRDTKLVRALELYESLEPADGAEGMLAMQMVGTHDAALECLQRAAIPDKYDEGRDRALRQADKLLTLYMQQLTMLDKRRGKGQQRVTVEHVTVASGGQAIVGHVEAGASTSAIEDQRPPALEHQTPMTLDEAGQKVPSKTQKS